MSGAQGTPELEDENFECFQNYTAPEVSIQGLAGVIDQQDSECMVHAQKQMLQRIEKTNEMLTNCNQLSMKTASVELKKMSGTQGTPESEAGSFECFQNYTAPEVFIQGLAGIVDQQDVESMIRAQKQMLQRFEKTNEMLTNCNQLSVNRLKTASVELKKHTAHLAEMKKDLDYIFKKIRVLKTKLSQQYPQAYQEAVRSSLGEEVVVEDSEQGQKSPESQILPQLQRSNPTEVTLDSDVQTRDTQLPKVREKTIKRSDSSSTETENENDQSKQDSSPYSSDTN